MTRFNWDDPLLLESQLTDEERQIRDAAHDYCQENLQPRVLSAFREERFDREIMNEMGELGLHGITVDPEDGGLGLGYLEHVIAVEEVSRASASLGLSYGAHSNLCINQIRRWGNEEQKAKYLPGLISGGSG